MFHALKTYLGIGSEPIIVFTPGPRPPESIVEALSQGLHAIALCGKIDVLTHTTYADCRFRVGHEQDALVLARWVAPLLGGPK